MADAHITSLPIGLAVRLLLDSTSYSNGVAEWFEPLSVNYREREERLRQTVGAYLSGDKPAPAFEIAIPKKTSESNIWVVPSVNDQIVCQAAVSDIASSVQNACVDASRVFSCLLNSDPNRLSFLEDQVSAWNRFQAEMNRQCSSYQCVLQFDLRNAFDSIALDNFIPYMKASTQNSATLNLLGLLLTSFSNGRPGIPFINDSVFFLGNAYLKRADDVVSQHTNRFIRFIDDYRIFGDSTRDLEKFLPIFREKLSTIGFKINDSKIRLGTSDEYFEAVAKFQFAEIEQTQYFDTAVQPGVFTPKDVHSLVSICLLKPDSYLQQGFGRLQLAALRRMRVRGLYSLAQGYPTTPRAEFADILAGDLELIRRICDLLEQYSQNDENIWRLLWLLYLSKDLSEHHIEDKTLAKRFSSILQGINQSHQLPVVARLWAASMPNFPSAKAWEGEIETLHSLGYVERGRRCYGG